MSDHDRIDARTIFDLFATRRKLLQGAGAAAVAQALPAKQALAYEEAVIELTDLSVIQVAYVDRRNNRVAAVKSFESVNPAIRDSAAAGEPYRAPSRNVYIGAAPTIVRSNVKRFFIVDLDERNANLSWFSSLKDSYTPNEYTHHFLLTLADRELARGDLGNRALAEASAEQKAAALDMMTRMHRGYNGQAILDDAERRAEAERYYHGREVYRPVLYVDTAPRIGEQATVSIAIAQIASLVPVELAQAGGSLVGGIALNGPATYQISAAAKAATQGISAPGAAVGNTASVGSFAGSRSDSGDGGSGSGGDTAGGGSSGNSGGGGSSANSGGGGFGGS